MSKQQHTPGPWHISELTKAWGVYDTSGTSVARVGGAYGVSSERRHADARLIAAAPELLIAAQMALQALIDRKLDGGMVGATLHEAIAKATGA